MFGECLCILVQDKGKQVVQFIFRVIEYAQFPSFPQVGMYISVDT